MKLFTFLASILHNFRIDLWFKFLWEEVVKVPSVSEQQASYFNILIITDVIIIQV